MKRLSLSFLILILPVVFLTGCVSREDADARLAKACLAGAKALMTEDQSAEVLHYAGSDDESTGMRNIAVTVKMSSGWLNDEVIFDCMFEESFSFMKTAHTGVLYRFNFGDLGVGQVGSDMFGDLQRTAIVTGAADAALQ